MDITQPPTKRPLRTRAATPSDASAPDGTGDAIDAGLADLAAAHLKDFCPGIRFRFVEEESSRFRKSGSTLLQILARSGPTACVISGKRRSIAIAVPPEVQFNGSPRFKVPLANFERSPSTSLFMLGVDIGILTDTTDRVLAHLVPFSGRAENLVVPIPGSTIAGVDDAEAARLSRDARLGGAVRNVLAELGLALKP